MKYFSINRDMKYIIYGAGGNCFRVKKLLQDMQYNVVAILDKRAEDIRNIGDVPVYTMESFERMNNEQEDSVIIISIKNVFEHIDIVRRFLALGYEKIIYKPLPILQGEHDGEWDSINDAYETILENNMLPDSENVKIACTRHNHLITLKNELLIENKDGQVLCWMPVEQVCNYDGDDAYKLMPMAAFYPMLNMYQYLLNVGNERQWEIIEDDFFLYSADWIERNNQIFTQSLKKSLLNSRTNIFGEMQKKADIDKGFFVRNAISVKRKDSFRFYLTTSGRNRVSFLIARGNRFIPAYMSQEDYYIWMHQNKFKELARYLEEENVSQLFTAVQHPMMIGYATQTTDYISMFCMPVVKEIYKELHWSTAENKNGYYKINYGRYMEEMEKLKIFVAVNDEGCIGRLLLMYGMRCFRMYSDEKQKKVSRLIDELFYIKDITINNDENILKKCRILILDSRIDISDLNDFGGDVIFLLQWGDNTCLNNIQETFANRKFIFQTIWQQEKVSGWMLTKQ